VHRGRGGCGGGDDQASAADDTANLGKAGTFEGVVPAKRMAATLNRQLGLLVCVRDQGAVSVEEQTRVARSAAYGLAGEGEGQRDLRRKSGGSSGRNGGGGLYGVNSFATLMMNSDEFKNDPRNPNAKTPKPADKH